ncbi:AAA-like domain-containing protein [Oscillatoriales cyanobacterium LEGE 11467]|uniref:AAA-like domain-containing protein n=1 Tax=Zarconia navalis LEGE 11467 TaxID=1828826 RepID=A0A928VYK0_9CYAN|nr:AAA-like domain-containing protein [Zarconia navalis]MBE9040100.1 AAA-like domain-containing protein [Zarconia navalis LEGE 11467]
MPTGNFYAEAAYLHTQHFLEGLLALATGEKTCSTIRAKLVENNNLFDLVVNADSKKTLVKFIDNYYSNSLKFDYHEINTAINCLRESEFLNIYKEDYNSSKNREKAPKKSSLIFKIRNLPSNEKNTILKWLFEEWNRKRELKNIRPLNLAKLGFGCQLPSFFSLHNSDDCEPDLCDPKTWVMEGSVPPTSPFYIKRPPTEEQCYDQVLLPSSLIRIRAPKLMGKTSLMSWILFSAASKGYKTVQLDFNGCDLTALANQRELLSWFWSSIARELKLEKQVADWDGMESLNISCSSYFEDYLLSKISTPLVLGLDQVDKLFSYEQTAPNFFGLLRAWHEKGKTYPLWQKLRLVVTYATDAYIPLNDEQSPFNVGMEVGLPDFTNEQVLELVRKHKLSWSQKQISELSEMVGGHPHLVSIAIDNSLQKSLSLREILQDAPTQAGIYSKHLHYCWKMLKKDPNLFEAFKKVVNSRKAILLNPDETSALEHLGLIKKEGNRVHSRYKLYQKFFREIL